MKSSAMIQRVGNGNQRPAIMPTGKVLALRQRDPWREATDRAREVAGYRETIVNWINRQVDGGLSRNLAVQLILSRHEAGELPLHVAKAMQHAAKSGRPAPS